LETRDFVPCIALLCCVNRRVVCRRPAGSGAGRLTIVHPGSEIAKKKSATPIAAVAREPPLRWQNNFLASRAGLPSCFQGVVSLFSPCYLLLVKLSKCLIHLLICLSPLNRLPVFLENLPVSRKEQGR
jgi:hypothetical protein